jgi:hypothetical protein
VRPSAVSALDFRKHAFNISRGKVVPRGGANHFELLPCSSARFTAARQFESLADLLGDRHAAGAGDTLNLAIFGVF